jgi:hypothetical protein
MTAQTFVKWCIYAGLGLITLGLIAWIGSKLGISFGKLSGDIQIQKEKFSFYFPIVTSIAVSIALTIVINLLLQVLRKLK